MAARAQRDLSTLTQLPPLTVATIGLALLALPLTALLLDVANLALDPIGIIILYWVVASIVIGITIRGEGLPLSEIGFRRPAWIDLAYILVTSVAILLVYTVTDPLVAALGLPVQEDATAIGAGVGAGIALAHAATTGIVEEILYRGYPIERLLAHTNSPVIAGGLTWGLFTAAHAVNWPLGNLLQTSVVAAVLTVVYLRRRTLVPVIGAHVLVWSVAALGQVYG